MTDDLSRRGFLKSSAGAAAIAAPGILRAQNTNNTVRIGWIGVGSRGYYLMERMYKSGAGGQVTAVCDTYTGHLARGKDRVQTMGGNTPATYEDYLELLQDPNIDAVVIATPEHLHYHMFMAALKAGKNVYVEKPLAHTIEEGRGNGEGCREVRQGGPGRHAEPQQFALPAGQGNGRAGNDRRHPLRARFLVSQFARRRSGLALRNPRRRDAAKHATGASFSGRRPERDRSTSIATINGGCIGIIRAASRPICWSTKPTSPTSSAAKRFQRPAWRRAEFIAGPATTTATCPTRSARSTNIPNKFHINYSCYFGNDHYGYGENFMGNEGTIEVLNRQYLNFYPEKFGGKAPANVAARKEIHVELPGNDNKAVEAHMLQLRSRPCKARPRSSPRPASDSRPPFPATWRRFRCAITKRSSGTTKPVSTISFS